MFSDSKTIFNALAEQYDAFRPHYPSEALIFLVTLGELDRTSDIADIGTGTGRIALELAKYVRLVYAIDTASVMLDRLNEHAEELGLTNIRTIEASAEETTLHDESLSMAIMAQSFHWVDKPKSLQEMHRILGPGKPLIVMWNQVVNVEDAYYKAVVATVKEYNSNYRGGADIISSDFQSSIEQSGLFDSIERFSFAFDLTHNIESYIGLLLSKSYIGVGIAQDKLPQFIEQVQGILTQYFPDGQVTEHYEAVILSARKR